MPLPIWPPKGYHTIATAAIALGISRQRVHQILAEHGVEPVTVGRSRMLTDRQVAQLRSRVKRPAGRPLKVPA